jgi:tRNA wybutosine-synthesizing protein 1
MIEPKKYADLIKIAQPDFIEAKGYVFVGGSRQRLAIENMPSHEEVKQFAIDLNSYLGYELIGEKKDSRVVLLSSGEKHAKIGESS